MRSSGVSLPHPCPTLPGITSQTRHPRPSPRPGSALWDTRMKTERGSRVPSAKGIAGVGVAGVLLPL